MKECREAGSALRKQYYSHRSKLKDELRGKTIGLVEPRASARTQDLCIKTSTNFSLLSKYSRGTCAKVL